MLLLSELNILGSRRALADIPPGKTLINTINAHSYNVAQRDGLFATALASGDYLLPDGASVVMACRWLGGRSQPEERVAGWDLFCFEMERINNLARQDGRRRRVMFMGSSLIVLERIRRQAAVDYPQLDVVSYSPPYKPEFSHEESQAIVRAINEAHPDLLWIGMTAPKQEKWTFQHWAQLDIDCHVGTIGAVFDFYAGTAKRAPEWWQEHALEWLYRLAKEPKRMWRRYVVGNPLFVYNIISEAYRRRQNSRPR